MNSVKSLLVLVCSLYLFGCASAAKMDAMIYQGDKKQYDENLESELNLGLVSGGQKTNPALTSKISNEDFKGALKESLKRQGLFSEGGRYLLEVEMLKVEQPLFGLEFTVTTHVQYILTDTNSSTILLNETIITPHTATFSDAIIATKRLRIANEGSGLKNIEGILNKLKELKVDPMKVSLVE